MQIRHRIPTIFSLSMVDVLCCALGCVILMWLLNLREFKLRSAAAAETGKRLAATQANLEQSNRDVSESKRRLVAADQLARETAALLQSVRAERDQLAERADVLSKDRDQTRADLAAARARAAALDKDLLSRKTENDAAAERLAKQSEDARILTREKLELLDRLAGLEKLLRERDLAIKDNTRRSEDLTLQLRDLESRLKQAQGAMNLGESTKERLGNAEARIAALEREKRDLTARALRAQEAIENRFAGMALSGRRIVFLIDMSGSMELLDEKTPAVDKWLGVRETVVKIMRSLQDMEKFQVILFSDRVLYPLGKEDGWLDFDPKTTPDQVLKALATVKPRGNTNVFSGLQSAFRFKNAGLDTIYFFSDGLPNLGEGLTAEAARTLEESKRSEILTRYIRNILKSDWNRVDPTRNRIRINTLGFFYESPEVGSFLWALARENDGSFIGMSKP